MTVRHDNPSPATYDLGQIRALARTRFGAAFEDCNTNVDGTLIFVYLPAEPDATTATAWANDLASYTVTHPTADDMATNQATVDTNISALIASLQADVTQDQSIIAGANPIIASTGTLSSATLSANVRSLATAVKALANNDINNKRAFANALRKIQGDYTDLTGT